MILRAAFNMTLFLLWGSLHASSGLPVVSGVTGIVKDPSGAAAARATVTLANAAMNAMSAVASNHAGVYPTAQAAPGANGFRIDCDFPGGNIIVDSIKGSTVLLHQDLRDTEGDWFYWYFRVRGAAGRKLHFEFDRGKHVIGVRGPAVSLDSGHTWRWLGAETARATSFSYAIPPDVQEVRFAVTIPYVESNLREFLDHYRNPAGLKVDTLCHTWRGRPVELLHLGKLEGQPDYRVLITARHHACEAMASYSLEGTMAAILADSEDGAWFRTHAEFLVVPFMDTDGVEDGDQGKDRRPHDHNRDYEGESIYASVRTLRETIPRWSDGRLRFALDMHDPWLYGPGHENIIFAGGTRDPRMRKQAEHFSAILESIQSGPLVFSSKSRGWWVYEPDEAPPETDLPSFGTWAAGLPGIWLATTIEIPYANAGGNTVTPESARALGLDLARALRVYLMGGK